MNKYNVGDLVVIKNFEKSSYDCDRVIAILKVEQAKNGEQVGMYQYVTAGERRSGAIHIWESEIIGKVTQP